MRDGPVLKAVAEVVKDHVGKAFAALRGRIDGIEQRFKELPHPEQGSAGPPGVAGNDGKDGAAGEPGPVGPAGADGRPGQDGDRGADGLAGEPGKDGRDGIDGTKGIDGAAGKDGKDGLNGKDGEPGPEGKKGIDGKDGIQGPPGNAGMAGKDGRDGIDGKDGAPGLDGKNGADGLNGKDAEPVDTAALTEAITQKVLAQIPRPIPGADGKDGTSVDLEAVRILVAGEVNKAVSAIPKPAAGRDGRDGRNGDSGMAGKDAADLDPLDGIDESMSYHKGQWARFRGGLIKAYRTTDPVVGDDLQAAGWAVMQEGIADIVQSLAPDERTVITTQLLTSGKSITNQVELPNMVYRGTYKEGQDYRRGDMVTQAGSIWHANAVTQDRPGISKAWTLAAKRGSDGKDLNGARQ